jgi:hypothetical protein
VRHPDHGFQRDAFLGVLNGLIDILQVVKFDQTIEWKQAALV